MGEWQPIETAPKDGTVIDLWVDGKRIADCYWSFSRNAATGERIETAFDCWSCDTGRGWSPYPNGIGGGKPTHWMPIPNGPEVK